MTRNDDMTIFCSVRLKKTEAKWNDPLKKLLIFLDSTFCVASILALRFVGFKTGYHRAIS